MWFEDLLLLGLLGVVIFLIAIPTFKFIKAVLPKKTNPLVEAKQRLEQAKLEKEAALLNKETEKLYEELYEEALQEDDQEKFQQEKSK